MIRAFGKSNALARYGTIGAVSASALYAFFLHAGGRPEAHFAAPAALLALSLLAVWISALLLAGAENLRRLSVLYNDMDPRAFLAAYEPLLAVKGLSWLDRRTVTNHLANAYAFSGDFDAAVLLLEKCETPSRGRRRFNAAALKAGNLCSIALLARDPDGAERALRELDGIIAEARAGRAPLSDSFLRNRRVQEAALSLLRGKAVPSSLLRQELAESANLLARTRLRLLLAETLAAEGDEEGAREQLDLVEEAGGATILTRRARELRSSLRREGYPLDKPF